MQNKYKNNIIYYFYIYFAFVSPIRNYMPKTLNIPKIIPDPLKSRQNFYFFKAIIAHSPFFYQTHFLQFYFNSESLMYKRIKIPIINEVTCKVKVTKLAQQIFISLHSIKSYHICIIVVPSNFSSRTHSLYFLLSYLAPRSKYLKYNNIYSNRIGRNAIIKIIARGEAECKLF